MYSWIWFSMYVGTITASKPTVDVYSIRRTNIWPPGYNVKLMAEVKTDDNLTVVKWIFQSQFSNLTRFIDASENHKKYSGSTLNYPSLLIWNLTYSDSGNYRCIAIHMDGTTESENVIMVVVKDVPVVEIEKRLYKVSFGESIEMKCKIRSARFPVLSVFWERHVDGGLSILHSRLSGISGASVDNPSLTIEYVSIADAGTYICCARSKIGTGKSFETNLVVIGDAPIISKPNQTYIEALFGMTVTIDISVESEPSLLEVYWMFKPHENTTSIKQGKVGMEGGNVTVPSLTIVYPTKFHIGFYILCAINLLGTRCSKQIQLIVIGELPVAGILRDEYLTYFGSNITLTCQITGTPKPTDVYWEKRVNNGSKLITSETAGIRGCSLEVPSLTILYATTVDTGMYTCHAVNPVGVGRSLQIQLKVGGALPKVEIGNAMYITVHGKMVTLDCTITAEPPVNMVYWIKNKNDINFTITDGSIGIFGSTIETPSLTIEHPAKSDAGRYWCFASNAIGHASSLSSSLIVIGDIPQLSVATVSYTANYGYEHTIECFVNATPKHTEVFWIHNVTGFIRTITEETSGVRGASVDVPSLTINTVTTSDIGIYTCMAKNMIGIGSSQQIELHVNGGIPEVFIGLSQYTIKQGEGVTLLCTVKAHPKHGLVYWSKTSLHSTVILNEGATGSDGITVEIPSLIFKRTEISDSGNYICYAVNEIGKGWSEPISLTVYKENNANLKIELPDSESGATRTLEIVFAAISSIAVLVAAIVGVIQLIKCRNRNRDSSLGIYKENNANLKIELPDSESGDNQRFPVTLENLEEETDA